MDELFANEGSRASRNLILPEGSKLGGVGGSGNVVKLSELSIR